jgi:hypothetical protein
VNADLRKQVSRNTPAAQNRGFIARSPGDTALQSSLITRVELQPLPKRDWKITGRRDQWKEMEGHFDGFHVEKSCSENVPQVRNFASCV